MTEVNCIICNKKFYPRYKKSKTCSKFCWEKNKKLIQTNLFNFSI